MRSKTANELFQYWNTVRGDRPLPRRDEIAPAEIRSLLPDLFMLQRQADGTSRFRLAGTGVCALFGSELRDRQFSLLWQETEKAELACVPDQVMTRCTPILVSAVGRSAAGAVLEVELLLTPLASANGTNDRVLGTLSPLSRPLWLHMAPVTSLTASSLSILGPTMNVSLDDLHMPPRTTAVGVMKRCATRRTLHLRVLDGGRRD